MEHRNYGFLWALDMGAEIVAVVDDDNVPLENWGEQIFVGGEVEVDYYETDLLAFDPVAVTEHRHLWHRGYPPQLLAERDFGEPTRKVVKPDVQADFWNGDPDIDAMHWTHEWFRYERLMIAARCCGASLPDSSRSSRAHRC